MPRSICSPVALACVVAILHFGCSEKGNPTGNNLPGAAPATSRVEIVASRYSVSGGNITVITPEIATCSGETLEVVPADTQTSALVLDKDSLRISLGLMTGTLNSLPGIDTGMAGMLSQIGAVERLLNTTFPVYAVFGRTGSGKGIEGAWELTGLDLAFVRSLDSTYSTLGLGALAATADSAVAIAVGKLMVDISADTMTATVDRRWYGERMIAGLADTTVYALSVDSRDDSTWIMTGNKDSADGPVTITADFAGNISLSNSAGQTHTYYLVPAVCPNVLASDWFVVFREANKK